MKSFSVIPLGLHSGGNPGIHPVIFSGREGKPKALIKGNSVMLVQDSSLDVLTMY